MAGKRPPVPDDTVFYALHPAIKETGQSDADRVVYETELLNLRSKCVEVVLPLVDGYIWQHEPFDLIPSLAGTKCFCHTPPIGPDDVQFEFPSKASSSLPHLHGKVKYGDNINDEWFVVFLMFAISRKLDEVAIRVWDTDGEFLLIEAAYSIPRWLKPENSWNRVFVKGGFIHVLPMPSSPAQLYDVPIHPSIEDAIRLLGSGVSQTIASEPVQQAIQKRLQSFGENYNNNMHNAVCRVPLAVAQILRHDPQLVALAVAAFYDRDLDSMKAASKMQHFLGNDEVEMVNVVVRMSRAMYAQLVQQVFQPPKCYPMPPLSDPQFREAELGMKITCGFEMMYWERTGSGSQSFDGDSKSLAPVNPIQKRDVGWQMFLGSLKHSGYFKGLLEGSKEYRRLMGQALEQYKHTRMFSKASKAINAPVEQIKEILALPHTAADFVASTELKSDDSSWLYKGEEELEKALLERKKEMDMYARKRAADKGGTSNLRDVACSMHSFVNKMSTFEGAELPDDEVGDDEVSLSMLKFSKELKSVCGADIQMEEWLPEKMYSSSSDMEDDSDSDGLDEENGLAESQPNTSIASYLTRESKGLKRKKDVDQASRAFMEEYSEALNKELNNSSLAKSFVQAETSVVAEAKETLDDTEGLLPVNIDANLLQNLLQSYTSQQGLPGPASNLLGAMGIQLPKDKDLL